MSLEKRPLSSNGHPKITKRPRPLSSGNSHSVTQEITGSTDSNAIKLTGTEDIIAKLVQWEEDRIKAISKGKLKKQITIPVGESLVTSNLTPLVEYMDEEDQGKYNYTSADGTKLPVNFTEIESVNGLKQGHAEQDGQHLEYRQYAKTTQENIYYTIPSQNFQALSNTKNKGKLALATGDYCQKGKPTDSQLSSSDSPTQKVTTYSRILYPNSTTISSTLDVYKDCSSNTEPEKFVGSSSRIETNGNQTINSSFPVIVKENETYESEIPINKKVSLAFQKALPTNFSPLPVENLARVKRLKRLFGKIKDKDLKKLMRKRVAQKHYTSENRDGLKSFKTTNQPQFAQWNNDTGQTVLFPARITPFESNKSPVDNRTGSYLIHFEIKEEKIVCVHCARALTRPDQKYRHKCKQRKNYDMEVMRLKQKDGKYITFEEWFQQEISSSFQAFNDCNLDVWEYDSYFRRTLGFAHYYCTITDGQAFKRLAKNGIEMSHEKV